MDLHKFAVSKKSEEEICHICISPYSSVFHNFQHIWSDFLAEVSTIRESSTNNVCIPDYALIYSAGSRP